MTPSSSTRTLNLAADGAQPALKTRPRPRKCETRASHRWGLSIACVAAAEPGRPPSQGLDDACDLRRRVARAMSAAATITAAISRYSEYLVI